MSWQRHTLQTHHVYSTLKRRGNGRFHVISTWNTSGVFVGYLRPCQTSMADPFCEDGSLHLEVIFSERDRKIADTILIFYFGMDGIGCIFNTANITYCINIIM